ncbi:HET-domain-containing protein [Daldinia sp. FL1419]|nr:HET-domain-containing protein [Daldinia sp. FL1419]
MFSKILLLFVKSMMSDQEDTLNKLIPYEYYPLSSNAHTRVLELKPSLDQSAPICCSLFEINLNHEDQSEYDALSYTWGVPNFTEHLVVEKCYLEITQNLACALRRFRKPTKSRMLWVDAICINQQDDREKARQIPFMRQIYRSASSVLVWLGADEVGADSLRRLHHLVKQPKLNLFTADITRELDVITKLPWFHRRWIIQEVVLNPNVVLNCAEASMPWARLVQTLSTGIVTEVMSSLITMAELWRDWILQKDDTQPRMFQLLTSFHDSECQDTRDVIYALGGLACDVYLRDNSYSTVAIAEEYDIKEGDEAKEIIEVIDAKSDGFVNPAEVVEDHGRTVIPVDYAVSAEWLYFEVVVGLLKSQALDIVDLLAQCAIRKTDEESDQMPSWIPDWRKPKIREPLWLTPKDAQGHLDPSNRSILIIQSSSIQLLGQVTNNDVSGIFPKIYSEHDIHQWFLNTWARLSELRVLDDDSAHQHQHQPNEQILARLVNTILSEKTPYGHNGLSSFNVEGFHKSWNEYRGYLKGVCEKIQQGIVIPEFYKFTWNYMRGRTIFIWQDAASSQPQYGYGPPNARPGDTILAPGTSTFQAYFDSGMRPLNTYKSSLVLRQAPGESDSSVGKKDRELPGNFRYVGDCQVMLYSGRVIHDLTGESDAYEPRSFSWFRRFAIS